MTMENVLLHCVELIDVIQQYFQTHSFRTLHKNTYIGYIFVPHEGDRSLPPVVNR